MQYLNSCRNETIFSQPFQTRWMQIKGNTTLSIFFFVYYGNLREALIKARMLHKLGWKPIPPSLCWLSAPWMSIFEWLRGTEAFTSSWCSCPELHEDQEAQCYRGQGEGGLLRAEMCSDFRMTIVAWYIQHRLHSPDTSISTWLLPTEFLLGNKPFL